MAKNDQPNIVKNKLEDKDIVIISNIFRDTPKSQTDSVELSPGGDDLYHRSNTSRYQDRQRYQDRPRGPIRLTGISTRPGAVREEENVNNGDTSSSMVYLNMSSEDRYIDAPAQVRVQPSYENTRTSNGPLEVTSFGHDPTVSHEPQGSDVDKLFPARQLTTAQYHENLDVEEEVQVQAAVPKQPTVITSFQVEDDPRTCEDYVDLPAPHSIILTFIFLGVAFVTGVLTMVVYTAVDAMSAGATVKVLCLTIIIPLFFFTVTCGLNCYAWCLARKIEQG